MNNTTLRKYLKSKTIWFAILLGILPIIPAYLDVFDLTPTAHMVLLQIIGFVVAVLRVLTTVPLSEK
jgi:F0F1-type ATP synthase assembly protein I